MYTVKAKTRTNSRYYKKIVASFDTMEDVKQFLDERNLSIGEKPYLFTHIPLSNGMVIQAVVEPLNVLTSPSELYDFLTA